jgi:protein TonB
LFDEVTKTEGGKNAAKRAGFVFGSTIFQFLLIVLIIWASALVKAQVIDEPKVDVKFVKVAAPPPPPAPPAPPPPPAAPKPPSEKKPPTNLPKPPPPQALIQPQEVKPEMKVDPAEPKEPQYDYSGGGEGVVGGVVGGVAPDKVVIKPSVEDAPVYAKDGYTKPRPADPTCVPTGVASRMSEQDMERLHGGQVMVGFAVGKDGQTSQFKVFTSGVSDRAKGAIWAAIQSCKWVTGTDASGKPVAILITLPIRLKLDD